MKSGILKHPYFGQTRAYVSNGRQVLQIKIGQQKNPFWFKQYQRFKQYQWKYCLFPGEVAEEKDHQFNSPIPRRHSIKKITYNGYFVTSLRDQIITRSKNQAKFSQNQILYITYTLACAWRQWRKFCKIFNIQNNFTAISSSLVLFNQEGQIRLITPFSAPLQICSSFYYAPQNIPPNVQQPNSWNKSILFSLGLIGSQLISLKTAEQFYYQKGVQYKFNFQQFQKQMKQAKNNVPLEIFNVIIMMAEPNPWVRLKLGQFQALLKPYHDAILDGRQSTIDKQLSKNSLFSYLTNKRRGQQK